MSFDLGTLAVRMTVEGQQAFNSAIDSAGLGLGRAKTQADAFGLSMNRSAVSATGLGVAVAASRRELSLMATTTGAAMSEVGVGVGAVGAAMIVTSALTTKAAIDWETAWTGVTKTVNATDAELVKLEGDLRRMARDTLPASHTEIAAVAEAAGQLGIQTGNIASFTRTMIDLGEATNLSASGAATELARFMNVMGTSQTLVSNVGSAVVDLGNNFATTEAEIVAMAQRLSGAATIVKLSEGDTLGLAAALSSVGIEAEAGGTAFSKVMINIASAVEKGGDGLDEFAEIAGLSADEFAAKWRTSPGQALAAFVTGLANVEAQGGSTFGVLERLGITEVRMRDALLRSAAAAGQFATAMDTGNVAFDENIALQEEADRRYATTESRLRIAGNAVTDMAIELGDHLLPYVNAAADGVADLSNMIGGLPDPLQAGVVGFGLLGGAVLIAGGAFLLAVPKIIAFRAAMATLRADLPLTGAAVGRVASVLAGPWGIAIAAGIAGLSLFNSWVDSTKPSADQLTAALAAQSRTARSVFETYAEGNDGLINATVSFDRLQEAINAVDESNNPFALFLDADLNRVFTTLRDIGDEMGALAKDNLPAAQRSFRDFAAETDGTDESLWRLLNAFDGYREQIKATAIANGDYTETMTDAEKRTVLLTYAQGDSTSSAQEQAEAYLAAADEADGLRRTLDELLATLDESNATGRDAITANIDYQDTLRDVAEQIEQIRAGTEGYSKTLDQSTQAGSDNVALLVDLAERAWEAGEAQLALDGNTDAFVGTLAAARAELIEAAIAMGADAEAAAELADQILKIPTEREIEIIAETAAASQTIDRFITQQNGRRIRVFVDAAGGQSFRIDGAPIGFQEHGSIMSVTPRAFGAVDVPSNAGALAQIRNPGDVTVWAEHSSGGEAYIPFAPDRRERSLAIWAEAGRRLGVVGMDSGGLVGATASNTRSATATAAAPVRIVGTLDLGEGLTGIVRGMIIENDQDTMNAIWGEQS